MNPFPQERESPAYWTIPSDVEQSIPDRFASIARLHPNRTAIMSESDRLTYEELDRAANGVARRVLETSLFPNQTVIFLGRHDVALFAGVLGILKSGNIAVVLNPSEPPSRVKNLAAHADAGLIIADAEHLSLAQQIAGNKRYVLSLQECPPGDAISHECVSNSPGDTAFIIYTSGSSGEPKGVIRSHRSLLHNAYRHASSLRLQPEDRVLHLAALSGGSGVSGACTALLRENTTIANKAFKPSGAPENRSARNPSAKLARRPLPSGNKRLP